MNAVTPPSPPVARSALFALAGCLALVLVLYRETAVAMVAIWARSDTFNHGFIVLPITLWLIWKRRAALAMLPAIPAWWVLPPLALAAFGWLLGDLAGINAVTQFALVTLLVLVVPAVLGGAIARAIAFPLAFMFFMVPVGEFAMPTLMDWTARFTVIALRASGLPVYQEGLQFVIPSGRWSVVEACSGVRYLIASVCVGVLYAYLNYVSLKRRLIFVGFSIVVPILANWARAYLIVMIGHLSGGRLAAGVDHLIYGWLFFGIVIAIMFAIGARWAETDVPAAIEAPADVAPGRRWTPAFALAVASIVAAPHAATLVLEPARQGGAVSIAETDPVPGWRRIDAPSPWQPAFEHPAATGSRLFERDGRRVWLQVAYYRNQDYARKLVSSNNVLVRSKDLRWALAASGERRAPPEVGDLAVRTAEILGRADERLLVWHWYWINGRLTSSDALAKFYTAIERLSGRGDDSAAVFLATPKNGADAERTLEDFLRDGLPSITGALDRTRAQATGAVR